MLLLLLLLLLLLRLAALGPQGHTLLLLVLHDLHGRLHDGHEAVTDLEKDDALVQVRPPDGLAVARDPLVDDLKRYGTLLRFRKTPEDDLIAHTAPSIPSSGSQSFQLFLPPLARQDSSGHSGSMRRPRLMLSYTCSGSTI